ncbi:MAG: mechanosensitive ion channel family protein [Flavobacteriaceae bacterium]|nr:mechanosensitive ion channel family protein [Bacteroidia bacterium]MBT8283844.1 mechanosensitive ion channel family protein [Muriicola sp.]NNK34802.1 mechanosensitive ion channel family protein [Eudoraea sp.]NNL38323.1 mechanosensitive ion channel family protein [Flavobacteriaceae bacterium]MBT8289609.1 mechanosensitive ion channel family protein [Muriicola sp.]
MEVLNFIGDWTNEHPVATGIIKFVVWVILIVAVIGILRRFLRKSLPNTSVRYKSQKGVEIVGYVLIIFLSISYFTGNIKDFTLAIGLLTAGITITLQELILSIAGSFYIFFVKVYKPGDRIEINGIKGDVIDIDSIYTTMMEIGQWVTSDNYSGRIVKLSNAFVFKGPVYNYSKDFPFIWDEFNLPIRYGSDIELAKQIIIRVASEQLSEYVNKSISNWKTIVDKYYIEDALVEPTLALTMTDNWIQFNLRYIVDYKKRRYTKHLLNSLIGKEIEQTDGKVLLASSTVEIIRIPTLDIDQNK